jgi:hypothetical protein
MLSAIEFGSGASGFRSPGFPVDLHELVKLGRVKSSGNVGAVVELFATVGRPTGDLMIFDLLTIFRAYWEKDTNIFCSSGIVCIQSVQWIQLPYSVAYLTN